MGWTKHDEPRHLSVLTSMRAEGETLQYMATPGADATPLLTPGCLVLRFANISCFSRRMSSRSPVVGLAVDRGVVHGPRRDSRRHRRRQSSEPSHPAVLSLLVLYPTPLALATPPVSSCNRGLLRLFPAVIEQSSEPCAESWCQGQRATIALPAAAEGKKREDLEIVMMIRCFYSLYFRA